MKKENQVKVNKTKKKMSPEERKMLFAQIATVAVTSIISGAFTVIGMRGTNCLMDKATKKPNNTNI